MQCGGTTRPADAAAEACPSEKAAPARRLFPLHAGAILLPLASAGPSIGCSSQPGGMPLGISFSLKSRLTRRARSTLYMLCFSGAHAVCGCLCRRPCAPASAGERRHAARAGGNFLSGRPCGAGRTPFPRPLAGQCKIKTNSHKREDSFWAGWNPHGKSRLAEKR